MTTPASSYAASYATPVGVGGGGGFDGGLAAAVAARDALRELACSAVAEREMAVQERDEASAASARLRADVMTLHARLAEANKRCAGRGESR